MGCNQSAVEAHALHSSNQKQVKPEVKQTQGQQNNIQDSQLKPQAQPQKKHQQARKQFPIDQNNFNKLPDGIKDKYKKAKQKGFFEDLQFPANQSSLGGPQHQEKIKPFLQTLVWLKPPQFLNSDFMLFDGIDPNDIKQGQLGDCYCLATVANYAKDPQKIVAMFPFYDIKLGFYVIRFYTNGKPNYIVVDDYFACDSSSNAPLFTNPIGNQIWVLLIEKAWAKIMGSYFNAEAMSADLFMQDLTACPTYGAWFKDKQNKTEELINCFNLGYLVVLSSSSKQVEGIVSDHAYSLLEVINHNGEYIFKIRNPWGSFQWNGQYGEQSPRWTPELIQNSGYKKGDDGIFYLSESELLQFYEYYSIAIDVPNSKYSYIQFQSQPEENVYFKFKLTKTGYMALRINQIFDRLVKDTSYKYSPAAFQLGKIEGDQVIFFSQGGNQCSFGEKSIFVTDQAYNQYEPGQYFVRIKMQWKNPKKYNTAVLSTYCGESVTFERIKQADGINLWKKMIYSFMQEKQLNDLNESISYGMEWMKAQMVCYAQIRENAEEKDYNIRWTFNHQELIGCKLALNKKSEGVIEHTIKAEQGCSIGTINRNELDGSCQAGSAQVELIE